MMDTEDLSSPPSEVSSTYSSSPYFRRRYDGTKTTRREALEQRFGKNMARSPKNAFAASTTSDASAAPQIPDAALSASGSGPQSPPRLTPKKAPRNNILPFDERVSRNPITHPDDEKELIRPTSTETTISAATSASTQQTTSKGKDSWSADNVAKSNAMDNVGDSHHEPVHEASSKPQHLQDDDSEVRYYRIIYRGVVALRSEPNMHSQRSGAYVSYGEIIASSRELFVFAEDALALGPSTPIRSSRLGSAVDSPLLSNVWQSKHSPPKSVVSQVSGSVSSLDTMRTSSTILQSSPERLTKRKVIRVDKVLTGGYAVDASDSRVEASDKTPKRANTQQQVSIIGPSPLPISDSNSISHSVTSVQEEALESLSMTTNKKECHGYMFAQGKQFPIYIPIEIPPKCEQGTYFYKVVSSTPLPIFTGPCTDAPKTKGMLIPGSVHEVCLRVLESHEPVCFLRLTRRRGWVADRKLSSKNSNHSNFLTVMEEVTGERAADECSVSVMSTATSTVATPVSAARRRHRPPRRQRDARKNVIDYAPLPRHVLGPSPSTLSHPRHQPSTNFESPMMNNQHDKGVMSPSSNVSLLSDESSLEHTHKSMTPDRSVARSAASSSTSLPTFVLMRVNAPRGLKILDAPHFQVNNLIHGNHPGHSKVSSPMKDLAGQTGNQSIFQTMAGHHTTTLTSRIGNPAIFDSITKARKLPRGSVFEASKRMETSGAFSQGAGLIKLSDLSGWAIVPRQEELDEQYRSYSGSLIGIKEGEATRAYEEVGNAIIDERHSSIHLRIHSKGGISVSLYPPASTISDDETSPTSSVAGSSAISGNGGQLMSQGSSDVASSVGSSFLDSMFRTPKKKDTDHISTESRSHLSNQHSKATLVEKIQFSTVIPCGMSVEVERWVDSKDFDQYPHKNEFARLCEGQGWIPRYVNGKAVAEIISAPEHRFGSFWFRVQDQRGIKVRLGPSKRAPSIKSDDGVYFRFECGEFLRSSEVVTFFRRNAPSECFAKLYRNRHARLHTGHGEVRSLASLTVQAEWVQVFGNEELYLEECATEPRIERHRQGWRYNVVLDSRIQVRKGPSFEAETNGVVLLGGESVLINERVIAPDDTITWLRLKDGQGWVHNVGREGGALMIPHSLRHRKGVTGRPSKPGRSDQDDIAYNTIIARLFHNDLPDDRNNSKDARSGRR